MEKNTYKVEEIILGLRPEMQKMERQLSILRHFCQLDGQYFKDFSFYLNLFNESINRYNGIVCLATEKTNWLERLSMKLRDQQTPSASADIKQKEDGHYDFVNKTPEPFPVSIKYNDISQQRFDAQVHNILTSDYKKNIVQEFVYASMKYVHEDQVFIEGDIGAHFIYFDRFLAKGKTQGILDTVRYSSNEDELQFIKCLDITRENITTILQTEIPKELLSPYHIHLIDNSAIQGKEIVLQEYTPYRVGKVKEVKLKIEETPKQLILKP